jgi:biopolymer transport protein ExbB
MSYLYNIVATSGLCGIVILLVGLLGLAFVAERIWAYARASWGMGRFRKEFEELAERGDWRAATDLCSEYDNDLAGLGLLTVTHGYRGPATLRSILNNHVDSVIMPRLKARLRELAMLAKIAPMLGLFGTVQGMIDAFAQIAGNTGQGVDPKDLANSIGLALGTTFLGLLVAMPISVALSLFQSKIEQFGIDLEKYTERCIDLVARHPVPPPPDVA